MAFIQGMNAKKSGCGCRNGIHQGDVLQKERMRMPEWRSSRESGFYK
ncbi:hypothetical protein PU629_14610 [Pullulanibacillus sp. KACC 23026]|nr:hypothetical protein [Pullulanibacillus sp. KACC 23026]WEG11390.1 hypothetical protein PU629_14610 [Pullulanibacillus sp. KACC 23026]